MTISLLDCFPDGMKPRDKQIEILNKIEDAIPNYKYIVLRAGTGVGKSAIAVTMAKYFKNAYIVTGTKDLQKQYQKDFGYPVMFGRGNFECCDKLQFGMESQCDDGRCQNIPNYKCEFGCTTVGDFSPGDIQFAFYGKYNAWSWRTSDLRCLYWEQKQKAVNAPITLMNYPSYFLEMNYIPIMPYRDLVVFDEAQNLEDQLMKQIKVVISNRSIKRDFNVEFGRDPPILSEKDYADDSGSPRCINDWIERLYNLQIRYKGLLTDEMRRKLKKKDITHLENQLNKIDKVIYELKNNPSNWIFDGDSKKRYIEIKPVWISDYTEEYMLRYACSHVLMMSATMPPKKEFCKWYGVPEDQVFYMNIEGDFPLKDRPIVIYNRGKMSRDNFSTTIPKVMPIINGILESYPMQKGIIHTQSNKFTKMLYDGVEDKSRLMFYTDIGEEFNFNNGEIDPEELEEDTRNRRERVIKMFKASGNPNVLIAPGIKEGVDLPGDLCRFQIIFKIPYPNFGDKQVVTRNKQDKSWANYKTINDLEQAYGRGVRFNGDKCDTFIVDGNIFNIKNSPFHKRFISKYLGEALDSAILK